VAIVHGHPPDSGTLDADLVRDAGLGRRGVARGGQEGRRAVTRYRVIERFSGGALLSVTLETGRTHQIRIHLADAGTPVLGDRVYGRREDRDAESEAPRQMLHARRLGFAHPSTGKIVRVESPLPEDFRMVLAARRAAPVRRTHGERKTPREGGASRKRRERSDARRGR
jgi:23S rRNA pseudouridine1911/1915/1917 synthase